MIINHLEKLFVTNDAATMMKELEVLQSLFYNFYNTYHPLSS